MISAKPPAKPTRKPLRFAFVPDPRRTGPCELVPLLRRLWEAGALIAFGKDFGQRGQEWGNCHDVSAALAADLLFWDLAEGWQYVSADQREGWGHTWLECDGWAVDGSSRSLEGRVLIQPARYFRDFVAREWWTWTWDLTLHELLEDEDDAAGVA